jgi:hypothetical protein
MFTNMMLHELFGIDAVKPAIIFEDNSYWSNIDIPDHEPTSKQVGRERTKHGYRHQPDIIFCARTMNNMRRERSAPSQNM